MDTKLPQAGEKPRDIKLNNRRIVLQLLQERELVTLGELAEASALSRNTVKKCLDFFLERDLAIADGKGHSTSEGGKKPDLFRLNQNWGSFLCFYVRHNLVEGVLYSIGQRPLCIDTLPLDAYTPENVVNACGALAARLQAQNAGPVKAAVCSLHGVVDFFTGTVLSVLKRETQWNGHVPLGEMLHKQLCVPVYCCNPIRTMLISEAHNDPAVRENAALIYTNGTAPMAALIRQGKVIQGKRCILGEIGGIPLGVNPDPDTALSGEGLGTLVCHQRLLAEMYHHAAAFPDSTLFAMNRQPSLQDIFSAAENSDPLGQALMRYAAKWFAVSIRQFLFLADPDVILLQGDYSDAGDYFLQALRQYVQSYVAPAVNVLPEIRFSTSDERTSCLNGSALLAASQLFSSDDLYE